MTTSTELVDPNDLVDAARYAARGYPHEAWTRLRREAPVHWCEPDGFRPFWAVTRHADIKNISSNPDRFLNAPRTLLVRESLEAQGIGGGGLRTIVNMDPPEHRDYRALAAPFFRPSALRALEAQVRTITRLLLDAVDPDGEPFDFVTDFASWLPLRVICHVLGAHADDEATVLRIANTAFGLEDPEFAANMADLQPEMLGYYKRVIDERRAGPTDDLYGTLVNARVNGTPIGRVELLSYFILMTTAGHDTTRNAVVGGLHALIEHPDQLDLLRQRPELCATAADEILRWTSPVVQFCRTPVDDVEIAGQTVRAGETLALFYPSGNRDEDVFDDPFTCRVDRDPNPQIAFGFGEHYCLGASLAHMEIRIFLEELVPRLKTIALAGEPQRTAAILVGGIKHLPIRWTTHARR